MKLNFRRVGDNTTLWELRTTNTDDMRTIYFALRAYRDQLHESLIKAISKNLSADDYDLDLEHIIVTDVDMDATLTLKEYFNNEGLTKVLVASELPQVNLDVLLNDCREYEDLMFLHETLFKVNAALFEIMDNHHTSIKNDVLDELDVS
jgi:hypothetical protein